MIPAVITNTNQVYTQYTKPLPFVGLKFSQLVERGTTNLFGSLLLLSRDYNGDNIPDLFLPDVQFVNEDKIEKYNFWITKGTKPGFNIYIKNKINSNSATAIELLTDQINVKGNTTYTLSFVADINQYGTISIKYRILDLLGNELTQWNTLQLSTELTLDDGLLYYCSLHTHQNAAKMQFKLIFNVQPKFESQLFIQYMQLEEGPTWTSFIAGVRDTGKIITTLTYHELLTLYGYFYVPPSRRIDDAVILSIGKPNSTNSITFEMYQNRTLLKVFVIDKTGNRVYLKDNISYNPDLWTFFLLAYQKNSANQIKLKLFLNGEVVFEEIVNAEFDYDDLNFRKVFVGHGYDLNDNINKIFNGFYSVLSFNNSYFGNDTLEKIYQKAPLSLTQSVLISQLRYDAQTLNGLPASLFALANHQHSLDDIIDVDNFDAQKLVTTKNYISAILFYYGDITQYKQFNNIEYIIDDISRYDILVLKFGQQDTNSQAYDTLKNIISEIKKRNVKVYGSIPVGVSTHNYSIEEITNYMQQWKTLGADGILLDEFGFDFGNTRQRQVDIVNACHSLELRYIANVTHWPDVLCDSNTQLPWDPTDQLYQQYVLANPEDMALPRTISDAVLITNYGLSENGVLTGEFHAKMKQLVEFVENMQVLPMLFGVAIIKELTDGKPDLTAYEYFLNCEDLIKYLSALALLHGLKGFGISNKNFGANGKQVEFYIKQLPFNVGNKRDIIFDLENGAFQRNYDNAKLYVISKQNNFLFKLENKFLDLGVDAHTLNGKQDKDFAPIHHNHLLDDINFNQSVIPESDKSYDIGSAQSKWRDIYFSGELRGDKWQVKQILVGQETNKPAAGNAGVAYILLDTNSLYYDDGEKWVTIGRHSIPWEQIDNKPTEFPHKHNVSDLHFDNTIMPETTNSNDIGSETKKWRNIYFSGELIGDNWHVKQILTGLKDDMPTPSVSGRLYILTDTKEILFDTGTEWISVGVGNDIFVNLDDRYVRTTGGTITGDLVISGDLLLGSTNNENQTLSFSTPYLFLNASFLNGIPKSDGGIRLLRGSESAALIIWNETKKAWEVSDLNGRMYKIYHEGYHPILWEEISNKPLEFTPLLHTHTKDNITDFEHTHFRNQIVDFVHTHSKTEIVDFAHQHLRSEITDFGHQHVKADILDFLHTHTKLEITDFNHIHLKSDIVDFHHTHTISEIIDLINATVENLRKINGRNVYIQLSEPSYPSIGDIWIQIR